jgi:hypothetical protein
VQQLTDNSSVPTTQCVRFRQWEPASLFAVTREDDRRKPWNTAIAKLHLMLSLQDDWDGMGADAPSKPIIISAIELVSQLSLRPDIVAPSRVAATPHGTVVLEWQQTAVYIEAEIVDPNTSEWMVVRDGESPTHQIFAKWPFIESMAGAAISPKSPLTITCQSTSAYSYINSGELYSPKLTGYQDGMSPAYWANPGFLRPTA